MFLSGNILDFRILKEEIADLHDEVAGYREDVSELMMVKERYLNIIKQEKSTIQISCRGLEEKTFTFDVDPVKHI